MTNTNQQMIGRSIRWIALVLVASIGLAVAQDGGTSSGEGELVAQVHFTREQFSALMAKMREVADLVEATEPETAQVLRQAAEQAELAFVEEDMQRVAELLNEGLLSAAESNQATVIAELEKILELLRSGTLDPDERERRLDTWENQLAALERLAQDQQRLEQESRVLVNAEAIEQQFRDLEQEVAEIVQAQKNLNERTREWSEQESSQAISRIAELLQTIENAQIQQETLSAIVDQAGLDQLPMLKPFQENLGDALNELTSQAGQMAQDSEWQQQLGELSESDSLPAEAAEAMAEVAEALSQAQISMAQAGKAMGESAAQETSDRQEDAEADLADAARALRELLDAASADTPAGQMAQEQADLARTTAELGNRLEELSELTGLEPNFGNVGRAAREMAEAANDLADQLGDDAAKHQQEAIDQLEEEQYRLAQLERRIKEMQERALEEQANDQEEIADRTDELAERMNERDEESGEQTPGNEAARRAGESMRRASGGLSQGQAGQANEDQKKALEELKNAIEDLETAIEDERRKLEQEQLAQIEQLLRKILNAQKPLTEATRNVYEGRDENNQYGRPAQLKLAELAESEGDIRGQVLDVITKIQDRGGAVVFTPLLEEVADDLGTISARLASLLPDLPTQLLQEDVEETLEEMLAAIKLEIEKRKRDADAPPPPPPGPGGETPPPPLVSMKTELKLLLVMQKQLLERTQRLVAGDDELTEEQREERLAKLTAQQDRIQELMRQLAAQAEEARPQPSGEAGEVPEEGSEE